MKNPVSKLTCVLLTAGLCLVVAPNDGAKEKTIALKDAPAPVQKAINDSLKGGKLKTLSVETENGKTEYEAEVTIDGHDSTMVMDPAGKVLEMELVVELSTVPEAARAGLTREAGKGTIAKVEATTKSGVTSYEALVKEKGKKDREIVVSADGKLSPEKK